MEKTTAIILAAGAGTRMKSKFPKVVHKVCGKSMVEHVIHVAKCSDCEETVVVIGHGADKVKETVKDDVHFVLQREQLGTGHAVLQAKEYIKDEGYVLLLYGDTPLIKADTLREMIDYHKENKLSATVLTAHVDNPYGYGRIVKDTAGYVEKIVEHKDANEEELKITEINSGMYLYDAKLLKESLDLLNNNNSQKEYYITDVVGILNDKGHKVGSYVLEDMEEILGVNSRVQLAAAEKIMRDRTLNKLMESGVTLIDPNNTYIDAQVEIGQDTIIYPGAIIKGNTIIGNECSIGHNTRIENSIIKDNVEIQSSTIIDSFVDEETTVGPYAYLRPNSKIGKKAKIGDFVEVKNATIGDNSKASHLAYIGDAEVGSGVNIGCGVVFVNYDGKNKHKTIVEDNAFVGSNCNLVAPVTIKESAYIATGSTITKEVPEGALSVARQKQRNIEGWVERKGLLKNK
ncbi:bifunctional UDP-N-acetylglucosamine diphosphorylase/glucosamine-1-phosphate N-acetyltransferase GlmU [Anaeromicrobium sediminis]|uniref:Bifunctional protein GlmU n=1 Tax=Anaeromicrobium sediminis TaxID=1478221 RepID=A0A267MFS2_9FIRM|nr:bifunctional UDP-N-acetylglucosamine diphosphorylase/glucosamine-1-phosphate N-acetyltransferase GlmU [Anaeromicrobium sediminis]PAB57643.1 UDP-N-acetylglucosamine diphosphorylase/glucosamine-1-phosphate N-acetyltransferase [Anaeromicrobium sediminis]